MAAGAKLGKVAMMARVGARLTNDRWGWDGVRSDGTIVFIGWDDHVVRRADGALGSCEIFDSTSPRNDTPGGHERSRHIEALLKGAAIGHLVLATPKDPAAPTREIAGIDPRLYSVRLERHGTQVLAVFIGEDSTPEVAFGDDLAADVAQIVASGLGETERAQLVQARRGQGLFRARVELIEAGCRVTGVRDRAHVRAVHIKLWRDATNVERLDGSNGLLLAPHVQHLFTRGFLAFEADGTALVSPRMDREVLYAWSIDEDRNVGAFTARQATYLAHHRANVFLSSAWS
ncbi:MAG: HNH endonuclease [Deltaproteobacteria bacterium]|nr:HNH endonuclease [Deltaproteobacteria bacterium]